MSYLIKFRYPITNTANLINNAVTYCTKNPAIDISPVPAENEKITIKPINSRLAELKKKLREKTPLNKLEEHSKHPFAEKQPLARWPNNTNPHTGEIGGPAGPEPTRYGDWERKGRVSDF